MSINLKMDGNTYEGATRINVGGKTIDIEEVNTVTPSTNKTGSFVGDGTRNVTIDTGLSTLKSITIKRSDIENISLGTPNAIVFSHVENIGMPMAIICERYDGVDFTGGVWNAKATSGYGFSINNGILRIENITNGVGGSGIFKNGATYNWYAF